MDSLAGGLLNLLGVTGSGAATSDIAPRVIGPVADQRALAEFASTGAISDPNVWSYYNTAMNRPTTFDEMMRLWNDMSMWDMVTAALTELVEEASQPDPTTERVIWYECSDKKFEDELNGVMLVNVDAETILPSQLWHIAGFGNNFDRIHYEQGQGVVGLSFAHPMDVRRYWLAKTRRCIGFNWAREQPDKDNVYVQGGTRIERPQVNYGNASPDDLWYPWDFLHMRRMFRMRVNEHGEPVFDEAQGVYKKLRMAIDQMTVHRAQVQPDRYLVNIDVQEQPPIEQVRTVQRWRQTMRNKLSFGPGSDPSQMDNPTDLKSYYNAWALDTILWMAKPKGFNHAIEKLNGTANVPDVYDIEMLLNIFYSVIGMPKSWVGIGDAKEGAPTSGRALLAQDMRFLRKVRALRKPALLGYTWLGYMHAMIKGDVDVSNLEIRARMSYIGGLEDQMRMEVLEKQVDIMDKMADMLKKYNLESDAWIDLVLRKYMHMPDDVVNTLRTALPAEQQTTESTKKRRGGTGPTANRARMREALDEIKGAIEHKYGKTIVEDLHKMLNGDTVFQRPKTRFRELNRFQSLPPVSEGETKILLESVAKGGSIISSFDTISNAVPTVNGAGAAKAAAPGEPGYRQFIGR